MPPVIGPFLATSPVLEAILMLAGFVFWMVAYGLSFAKGRADRVYSIPWPNICLNLAWEIYFGVLCPLGLGTGNCPGSNGLALVLLFLWLVLDLLNAGLLLRYGRAFQTNYYLRRYFYLILGLFFVLGFFGELTYIESNHDVDGTVTAWIINLSMSLDFIGMYTQRSNSRGLSLGAAWAKMLGSAAMGLGIVLSQPLSPFMSYLILTTFLADCLYIWLLRRRLSGYEAADGGRELALGGAR